MRRERPSLFEMIQALGRRLKTNPRARLSDRVPKADNPLRRVGREMAALEAQGRKPQTREMARRREQPSTKQLANRRAREARDMARRQTPKLDHARFWRNYDLAATRLRAAK